MYHTFDGVNLQSPLNNQKIGFNITSTPFHKQLYQMPFGEPSFKQELSTNDIVKNNNVGQFHKEISKYGYFDKV